MTRRLLGLSAAALVVACGGGNPIGNAPDIQNPPGALGQKLAFAYFQACINPIFEKLIRNGNTENRCASGGCHDNVQGTGGQFRLVPTPAPVDVLDATNTPDVIRTTDAYKNFYTTQGMAVIGAPLESRVITKPLVLAGFHGGGQVFSSLNDPDVKRIEYWITHPAPKDQDEFSTATFSMFTPPVPDPANCNTQ